MTVLSEAVNYIANTNLFNFVIFLGIIIYVCKKIDVSGKLEAAKISVAENIENSKNVKLESESELKKIEESVANIEDEIDSIIKKSEENANTVGSKIMEDAVRLVENIRENTDKTVEAKTELIKSDLVRRAAVASVEVAKSHIINELKNNPDLHNKLIEESLDAVSGVEI